jgi:hypothetical protein
MLNSLNIQQKNLIEKKALNRVKHWQNNTSSDQKSIIQKEVEL